MVVVDDLIDSLMQVALGKVQQAFGFGQCRSRSVTICLPASISRLQATTLAWAGSTLLLGRNLRPD